MFGAMGELNGSTGERKMSVHHQIEWLEIKIYEGCICNLNRSLVDSTPLYNKAVRNDCREKNQSGRV